MKTLQKHAHDLKRFGFTPSKWRLRFSKDGAPVVLANSIPKSGTHLLESLLVSHPLLYRKLIPTQHMGNLPGRKGGLGGVLDKAGPGVVIVAHLRHHAEWEELLRERRIAHLLMVRDPRDVAVSGVHYICKNKHHHLNRTFADLPDFRARLKLFLEGSRAKNVPSLEDRFSVYLPWLATPCLVVRFEDLVGSGGGGDDHVQRKTVARVFRHLNLDLSEEEVSRLATRTFSTASPTYRKGRIQQWRESFDDELKAMCHVRVGHVIEAFGYSSQVLDATGSARDPVT